MRVCEHSFESSSINVIPCRTIVEDDIYSDICVSQNKIVIWCLHKFAHNAHSHVQLTYSLNGCLTSYMWLGVPWLITVQTPPESNDNHFTLAFKINKAFSTLAFVMCSKTLLFINQCFFISDVCI